MYVWLIVAIRLIGTWVWTSREDWFTMVWVWREKLWILGNYYSTAMFNFIILHFIMVYGSFFGIPKICTRNPGTFEARNWYKPGSKNAPQFKFIKLIKVRSSCATLGYPRINYGGYFTFALPKRPLDVHKS